MSGASRTNNPVETVSTRPDDATASKPGANLVLEHGCARFTRQYFVGEPIAKVGLGFVVEGGDGKIIEDRLSVTASGAARPVIAVESIDPHADLTGQMGDHCRREVSFLIGKTSMTSPIRELRGETKLAGVNPANQQGKVTRRQRPALNQFVRRPKPSHRALLSHPISRRLTQAGIDR